MDWREFAFCIKLAEGAVTQIEAVGLPEEEYQTLRCRYIKNHEQFFDEECRKNNAPQRFLAIYCRMACDLYEEYQRKGVEEQIFWDTFADLHFWCENYYREYGVYGIGAYDWFWRHMDMTVFRLGRLQFEQMKMEYSVGQGEDCIKKGTPVINIHIPQGEPLKWERCRESIAEAQRRFGRERPYVCHTWMLFPQLIECLAPSSNILEFQKHFHLLEIDFKEKEAEERLYGKVLEHVSEYQEQTSLQVEAKKYLMSGRCLGNGWGKWME